MFACGGCGAGVGSKEMFSRGLWFSTTFEEDEDPLSESSRSFYHFLYPSRLQTDLETYEYSKIRNLKSKRISSIRDGVDLKAACRLGLRDEVRPAVWRKLLRVDDFRSKRGPGFYASLLETGKISRRTARSIEVDLPRTFPDNKFFREDGNVVKLRNILFAFSVLKPEISYCQGLNFVAGVFLLVFSGDEETAFIALANLIDSDFPEVGLHIAEYYSPGMRGILIDLKAVSYLVSSRNPRAIHSKYPVEIFSSEWLHGLFTTIFPITVVLRIWDLMISEGWKILFRITGTIWLKLLAPVISSVDTEIVLTNYKRSLRNFVDHESLVTSALHDLGSLSRRQLGNFRLRAADELGAPSPDLKLNSEESEEAGVGLDSISLTRE